MRSRGPRPTMSVRAGFLRWCRHLRSANVVGQGPRLLIPNSELPTPEPFHHAACEHHPPHLAPPMHRPGTNPDDVQQSDILCDFCHAPWTEDRPMVEGHHGSIVCGSCLTVACAEVIVAGADDRIDGYKCTMCLENRPDAAWRSPAHDDAFICRRCIELAAGQLAKRVLVKIIGE